MNKVLIYCSVLLISFFVLACSPAKRMQRESRSELRSLLRDKIRSDRNINYSMDRMRIEMQGGFNIAGNGRLYIKRNDFIYLTVQFLGMEIARGLVTKDSVFYINRVEQKYLFLSMKDLQQRYNRRVNYNLIENFLIKGVVLPGRVNPRHIVRFIDEVENGFTFNLGGENQNLKLNYDDNLVLMTIEMLDSGSETFINSAIRYIDDKPVEISARGYFGGKQINAKILPGVIGTNTIDKPSMIVNPRYSEISF